MDINKYIDLPVGNFTLLLKKRTKLNKNQLNEINLSGNRE